MKIAVIGGAGFIGQHVVRRLLAGGMEVTSIDRRVPAEPSGERILVSDLLELGGPESASQACGATDAVVWLAATIRHQTGVDATAAEDLKVMVHAPLRFLAALPTPASSVVYLSSIQVYGAPRYLPIDEAHPTDPLTAYGAAKLCAEHYLRITCETRAASFAALRVAFVYGPGQHAGNVIPVFLDAVRRGEPPVVHGEGGDLRDDVYVEDVAKAVELAVRSGARGTFNIASGRPHTILQVAEAACRIGGGGLRPRREPIRSGWLDRWFAVERAREALGFEATTSLEEGLRAMWRAQGPPA